MSTDSEDDARYDEMPYEADNFSEFGLIDAIVEGFTNVANPEALMDAGSRISENDINFDRSLPGLHTYLGENSMSIDSGNYQEPGTIVTLRAIYRHGIVLIPGYTLPLKTANTSEQQVLDFYRNPVAVLPGSIQFYKYTRSDSAKDFINQIATIAHLVSVRVDGLNYNPILLGRQRLRILDIYLNSQDQYRYCKGLVLPENVDDEVQCPVSRLSIPLSLCRFACDPEFAPLPHSSNDQPQSDEPRSLPFPRPGDPFAVLCSRVNSIGSGDCKNSEQTQSPDHLSSSGSNGETSVHPQLPRLPCRRDVMATLACSVSNIPPWVFHQHDLSYIVGQIRAKLSQWTNTWQMEKWNPSLAVPFSYWLIQNLPLTYIQKADFLRLDPVVARLRACLNFIETFSGLACAQCRSAISSQSYVICLTDEGSVQAYVNPHGFIFDMLTLSTVRQRSVALVGSPTTEYAWTIAECVMCGVPLGWRFTATRDDLRPRLFWGIKREALQHISEGEESQNIRWEGSELEDDESMVMSIPPEMADILDFLDSNDASLNSD
ncbi:unnamed protein product [Hymenolepis diminuta]|uniref:CULT domain-containing protein n=1 Tax=Hymenolepis diminuta TaxID=6216 RepID=A0A0R3SWK0_HYMDI|nr:unnamed protein product [Hymenolepis diminuta]